MTKRFSLIDFVQKCRCTLAMIAALIVFHVSNALAQVRPTPMGSSDAEIMIGREWAGYFIGGFLLLIVLVVVRNSQKQKQKEKN